MDIRSDLYSLGATLWNMLTGQAVFRGSPAEVMYHHQHAPLPLEQLEGVPRPVVALLATLLEKDPACRFQKSFGIGERDARITEAIKAGCKVTRQKFQKGRPVDSRVKTRKPLARLGPEKVSVAKLPVTGCDVFGREEDLTFLDTAWANQHVNVVRITLIDY